ncbi:MAG TPA: hypothetical protein VGI76_08580 [Solirubrobacteraceae bacterium]|jgi:hypothetical protein
MPVLCSSISRSTKALAIGTALAASCLALLLGGTATANATENPYCNPRTLAGGGACSTENTRTFNALFGWGDNHAVCVSVVIVPPGPGISRVCSHNPGEGVYDPLAEKVTLYAGIDNPAAGSNTVHGVSFN